MYTVERVANGILKTTRAENTVWLYWFKWVSSMYIYDLEFKKLQKKFKGNIGYMKLS